MNTHRERNLARLKRGRRWNGRSKLYMYNIGKHERCGWQASDLAEPCRFPHAHKPGISYKHHINAYANRAPRGNPKCSRPDCTEVHVFDRT